MLVALLVKILTMQHRLTPLISILALMLAGCGGGSADSNNSNNTASDTLPTITTFVALKPNTVFSPEISPTPTPPPINITNPVTLNGQITFDFVPLNEQALFNPAVGLDYDNIQQKPARNIEVQLLNSNNDIIAITKTDNSGNYTFELNANSNVRIRAVAQISQANPSYQFKITDNTRNNATYTLTGRLEAIGIENQTRDLNANSGWGGQSYTSIRAAAPFAIVDTIYTALLQMNLAEQNINIGVGEIRWSPNNRAVVQNISLSDGRIPSSFFDPSANVIYLLGNQNADTDEYDQSVIVHEFAHFLESNISRSDSRGGSHTGNDKLDFRLAYSEAFGNAFSGYILDNPFYFDTLGVQQQNSSFRFSISQPANAEFSGWFNETSIQNFLYDFFTENTFNFNAFLSAITDPNFINSDALINIFSVTDKLKQQNDISNATIETLAAENNFSADDRWGTNETNNGGISTILPVYKTALINGSGVNVCSITSIGKENKLGNSDFVRVNIPNRDSYSVRVKQISGDGQSDPDFFVYQNNLSGLSISDENSREDTKVTLEPGYAVFEIYNNGNINTNFNFLEGNFCYEFTISNE